MLRGRGVWQELDTQKQLFMYLPFVHIYRCHPYSLILSFSLFFSHCLSLCLPPSLPPSIPPSLSLLRVISTHTHTPTQAVSIFDKTSGFPEQSTGSLRLGQIARVWTWHCVSVDLLEPLHFWLVGLLKIHHVWLGRNSSCCMIVLHDTCCMIMMLHDTSCCMIMLHDHVAWQLHLLGRYEYWSLRCSVEIGDY